MMEAGELVRLDVERVAHGGTCVAHSDGRVVFVSGTLPGERVLARVTDVKKRFARAVSVEVLTASEDRVPHVWPLAENSGVGGADLGHVALPAQREWKRHVLAEQLDRLAGIDWQGSVAAADGDDEAGGLGWRTRLDVVSDSDGRLGMRAPRSHRIVPLDSMPLAVPAIGSAAPFEATYAPGRRFRLLAPSDPAGGLIVDLGPDRDAVRTPGRTRRDPDRPGPTGRAPDRSGVAPADDDDAGPAALTRLGPSDQIGQLVEVSGGLQRYFLSAAGFWQAHRVAPALLADQVVRAASEKVGDGARVWDLYAGAGLFSVPLAQLVGPAGSLRALDSDAAAADWARRNLVQQPWASAVASDTARAVADAASADRKRRRAGRLGGARPDLVVLDPPRQGAGLDVARGLAAIGPSRIVYVACDPASLARDLAMLVQAGYRLTDLRAFDLFPHTHHLEAIAVLDRPA